MSTRTRATIKDLYDVPDEAKAEIVTGEMVRIRPAGDRPARAGGSIYVSLLMHEKRGGGVLIPTIPALLRTFLIATHSVLTRPGTLVSLQA